MKEELSIEEKAKRYDEVIERAKKVLLDCTPEEQKVVEYITPELKESEDERIRRECISIIKAWERVCRKDGDLCEVAPACIAWLEKQGKNNMSISEATKQELEDNLNKALEKETPESCNEFLEKQGEQKTVENKDYSAPLDIEIPFGAKDSELIQETIRIPDGCYAFIEGNEIVIKKGEKPAWSEEDEKMFNSALWHVKNSCSNGGKNSGEFEVYNWLKSLKDRVQPKVELTQLDKNILEAAIAFVELNNHFNCWRGVNKHTVVSALHSLEPQNTWKPSDLQIEALDSATENCAYSEYQDCLRELIWQLKKLREE